MQDHQHHPTQSMDSNDDSTISISVFVFGRTVVEDLGPHEYVMGVTLVE